MRRLTCAGPRYRGTSSARVQGHSLSESATFQPSLGSGPAIQIPSLSSGASVLLAGTWPAPSSQQSKADAISKYNLQEMRCLARHPAGPHQLRISAVSLCASSGLARGTCTLGRPSGAGLVDSRAFSIRSRVDASVLMTLVQDTVEDRCRANYS